MANKFTKTLSNKTILLGLSIVLGIAAIIVIYNMIDIREVIKTLSHTTPLLILLYVLIQATMYCLITWRWKTVLESQGITHISTLKLAKYVLVGQGVSFLTPSGKLGGDPIRAGLVSSREDVKFEKALSSVVIDRALDVTAAVTFFALGLVILLFVFVISPAFADLLLVISGILLAAIIIFNYRMLKGKKVFHNIFRFFRLHKFRKFEKFEQKLIGVEKLIIKFYHKDTKYFYQAIFICLMSWILMFFEYKVAGLMVGQNLNPLQSFLIFSFVGIAYIVPVPMALGSLEASQISAFSIMGISAAAGLALSFLVRLKDFIIAIVGVIILGTYGISVKKTVKDTDYLNEEVEKLEHMSADKKQSEKQGKAAKSRKKSGNNSKKR